MASEASRIFRDISIFRRVDLFLMGLGLFSHHTKTLKIGVRQGESIEDGSQL
jgi:hypothetical protein